MQEQGGELGGQNTTKQAVVKEDCGTEGLNATNGNLYSDQEEP